MAHFKTLITHTSSATSLSWLGLRWIQSPASIPGTLDREVEIYPGWDTPSPSQGNMYTHITHSLMPEPFIIACPECLWEETREPGGNSHKHRENIQKSTGSNTSSGLKVSHCTKVPPIYLMCSMGTNRSLNIVFTLKQKCTYVPRKGLHGKMMCIIV